jgi:subtilisin family serine protease
MNNAEIDIFDNTKYNIPALKITRDKFVASYYVLEIPLSIDPFDYAKLLDATNEFETILFDVFAKINSVPNDPLFSYQWNLSKVDMTNAWEISKGNSEITVAVIDVGGDYNHEDLIGNKWGSTGGYDFIMDDSDPYPDGAKHGTAVAGVIAARSNNLIGVSGISGGWDSQSGVKLMHLRAGYVHSLWGEIVILSAAAEAVYWAAEHGANVVNMSFGYEQGYEPLITAMNSAYDNYGVIFITSAGNYFPDSQNHWLLFPAYCQSCQGLISVGATIENDYRKDLNDETNEPGWGSRYGSDERGLDIVAPGIHIPTTDITGMGGYSPDNYHLTFTGTSAATPLVAGLAGLLLSLDQSLDYSDIYNLIISSAIKVPGMSGQNYHEEYGYGRVDVYKTLINRLLIVANMNKSYDYNATSNNNGRRLAKDQNGVYHFVFASGNNIFYKKSTNNGSTWSSTVHISTDGGQNKYPSIATHGNFVFVTWQQYNGIENNQHKYTIQGKWKQINETDWHSMSVSSPFYFTSPTDPTPVIIAADNVDNNYTSAQGAPEIMIAFKKSDGIYHSNLFYSIPDEEDPVYTYVQKGLDHKIPNTTSDFLNPSISINSIAPIVLTCHTLQGNIYAYYTLGDNWTEISSSSFNGTNDGIYSLNLTTRYRISCFNLFHAQFAAKKHLTFFCCIKAGNCFVKK